MTAIDIGLPGLTSDRLGKPMGSLGKCWFALTSSGRPPRVPTDGPAGGKAAASIQGMDGPPTVPHHSYGVRIEIAAQPIAGYEIPSHLSPAEFVAALGAVLDRLRDEPQAAPGEAGTDSASKEQSGSRCGLW